MLFLAGIATALKLMTPAPEDGGGITGVAAATVKLERNEIIALVNLFAAVSRSVETVRTATAHVVERYGPRKLL